jgi:hypothetical protein
MIFGRYDERGASAAVGVAAVEPRAVESGGPERPPRPYYPEPGR